MVSFTELSYTQFGSATHLLVFMNASSCLTRFLIGSVFVDRSIIVRLHFIFEFVFRALARCNSDNFYPVTETSVQKQLNNLFTNY